MKISRRNFIKYTLASGVLCAGVYPFYLEPTWLSLEKTSVPIKGLPKEFHGFRIGLLSDFHMGDIAYEGAFTSAVEMINREKPDVVLLAGDFVQGEAGHIHSLAPLLKKMNAPLGLYAVLGNHEYWTDAAVATKGLEDHGIRVLVNRSVPIDKQGSRIYITGLDDAWSGRPDIKKAMEGTDPNAPKILMVHELDYADSLVKFDDWIPLQVSGHSHGGQIRIPFYGSPKLPFMAEKYVSGLYRIPATDRWVYTTRGVGGLIPMRFNCRPEVTLLTLESV